eukprot:869643-Pleurochrysis_carterae.AAC.2
MFCLAYVRRQHDALQGRKLEPRADRCMHLGTSPIKLSYRLEVLDGPHKGKLITTTQVVFCETVFPLRAEYQPQGDDTERAKHRRACGFQPLRPSRDRSFPSSCSPPGCGRRPSGRLASPPEGRPGLHHRPARQGHAQRRRQGRCAAWYA